MYATAVDFIETFGEPETIQLTNLDVPAATTVNLIPLEKAIAHASEIIDGYCGYRYRLPLAPTPAITAYCLDIARYRLDRIRSREDVRQRFEDAIAYFKRVAEGKVSLGADQAGVGVSETISTSVAAGARSCREPRGDWAGYNPQLDRSGGY